MYANVEVIKVYFRKLMGKPSTDWKYEKLNFFEALPFRSLVRTRITQLLTVLN